MICLRQLVSLKKTKKEQQRIDKILDMISKKINENYKIELDAILPNE